MLIPLHDKTGSGEFTASEKRECYQPRNVFPIRPNHSTMKLLSPLIQIRGNRILALFTISSAYFSSVNSRFQQYRIFSLSPRK